MCALVLDRSVLKDTLMGRRALSHVFLAKGADMGVEAPGVLEESVYISYLNRVRVYGDRGRVIEH